MALVSLSSRAIIGEYYMQLKMLDGKGWYNQIGMYVTSDQPSEEYRFLGQAPTMRPWIGERIAKQLQDYGFIIRNIKFEATLEVAVDEIERDKTSQVQLRINELARRTNTHWASLVSSLLTGGESTPCYDGQFFFDTDHQEGSSGVQSNLLTLSLASMPGIPSGTGGSATNPSAQVMADALYSGASQIAGFKDDQGEPINETLEGASYVAIVPLNLRKAAQTAILANTFATSQDNLLKLSPDSFKVVANPRLTNTSEFYIMQTDGPIKPFILQEEKKPKMQAKAEGSEFEFDTDKHQYGVKAKRNAGYGGWQTACKVKLTA